MTKPEPAEIVGPAMQRPHHIQDREISTVAGSPKAWRRLDGIAYLKSRKLINSSQEQAAIRLQEDYEKSQMQGGAQSGHERTSGGRKGYDIPDAALDAGKRLKEALSVLTPEILSITVLFLLPHTATTGFSLEHIAKRVGEDKRAINLGIRTALSLLARHYGN